MGQNVEGYFGYGIYIGSPEIDVEYYSRLRKVFAFFGLDGTHAEYSYQNAEYDESFTKKLDENGLTLAPQYSYEAECYCLVVKRSLVKAFEDPEVISVRHVEDRTGYEIMDKLAAHLEMSAEYMVWGFYG